MAQSRPSELITGAPQGSAVRKVLSGDCDEDCLAGSEDHLKYIWLNTKVGTYLLFFWKMIIKFAVRLFYKIIWIEIYQTGKFIFHSSGVLGVWGLGVLREWKCFSTSKALKTWCWFCRSKKSRLAESLMTYIINKKGLMKFWDMSLSIRIEILHYLYY